MWISFDFFFEKLFFIKMSSTCRSVENKLAYSQTVQGPLKSGI